MYQFNRCGCDQLAHAEVVLQCLVELIQTLHTEPKHAHIHITLLSSYRPFTLSLNMHTYTLHCCGKITHIHTSICHRCVSVLDRAHVVHVQSAYAHTNTYTHIHTHTAHRRVRHSYHIAVSDTHSTSLCQTLISHRCVRHSYHIAVSDTHITSLCQTLISHRCVRHSQYTSLCLLCLLCVLCLVCVS
jgi:hypothetical protein